MASGCFDIFPLDTANYLRITSEIATRRVTGQVTNYFGNCHNITKSYVISVTQLNLGEDNSHIYFKAVVHLGRVYRKNR
ncbi:MAG: hypothetical protein CFH10_01508 [Alphaproteobacteria bacterium MarineAlpha4_Bin2]|nr:MAG: hypothetical protein CFH10_01508 [Alphaproteobacteria bacterium MarineAlpha4_Bin2]